jgi:hypothetical protein
MKRLEIAFLIIVFLASIVLVSAHEIMTVEANVLSSVFEPEISIEVPDYIFFGNLTKGEISEEFKVTVNNTGNVDVTVTPELVNSSEDIFSYTSFRFQKTSNGTAVPFTRIGEFSFDVEESDDKYFYMALDLRNYPKEIETEMLAHQAEIRFVAMEKE